MKHIIKILLLTAVAPLMTMCSTSIPDSAKVLDAKAKISPDYSDIDIPVNIAPLNFNIEEKGDAFVTRFYSNKGDEIVCDGRCIDIDVDQWHRLLANAQGDTVYADVYASRAGVWHKFAPLKFFIAEEIDPYISYRHIEPLYVNYEILRICQRSLECFDVRDIYNNCAHLDTEGDRQCMNCHSYQNYNKEGNMQMHVRVVHPGTLIVHNGEVRKVNLKVGDLLGPGAYCHWHPTLPIIAYSVNDTWQHFHSTNTNKVEVQDAASDLIIYNINTNTVQVVSDSPTELETFPAWSADGKSLYYSSASVPQMTKEEMAKYRMTNYKDIKYNILKRDFDEKTSTFGPVDTVYNAAKEGLSATFARESPDGRFLLFTVGEYGTFHNFHHDADLYILDRQTGMVSPLADVNSDDTESYHNWSSNGRWIIFSSRRENGSFTRLYLAHFDKNGKASKPFKLPQRTPSSDDLLFQSYNVPEFMVRPVEMSRNDMIDAVEQLPVDAIFKR